MERSAPGEGFDVCARLCPMEDCQTIAQCNSPRGEVVLRRRLGGDRSVEELIINGVFAMDGSETATERRLAEFALPRGHAGRVLIGGLGLGYTVLAVAAEDVATIDVVEIEQCLIDWACQGITATLAATAADSRVRLYPGDVRHVLEATSAEPVGPWDAIVLDVDNGPDFLIRDENRAIYTASCLGTAYGQLTPGGTLAIWCQQPSPSLRTVLQGIAQAVNEHIVEVARGIRSFRYAIYTVSRGEPCG